MRLERIILGLLLLALAGCNSDPRCRRETALLRAEILDLEDKYFITKAQRDEALALLNAQGRGDLASKISARTPIDQYSVGAETQYDEMLYDDGQYEEMAPGLIGEAVELDSQAPHQSDIIFDGMQLPARPLESAPRDTGTFKKPATPESVPRAKPRETNPRTSILESAEELPDSNSSGSPSVSPGVPENQGSQFRNQNRSSNDAGQLTGASVGKTVTEIVIDRDQTGFVGDGSASPTLSLLLKPRDARGQSRRVAGTLTISILDPESTSSEQRIGIWKFLPEEVELFFTEPNFEPGIQLNLPFDDAQPQGKQVVVLARLQMDDGRALETTARISTTGSARKIKIQQGEDDQLAERNNEIKADPASTTRPAWRPVR